MITPKKMIAVVQIGGHQAIVEKGETLTVDRLKDVKEGDTVELPVLLLAKADGSAVTIGDPFVKGKTVKAKVLEHGRGDKIRVYKMKPRKRYRREYGHRQPMSVIEITGFPTAAAKKAAPKAEAAAE